MSSFGPMYAYVIPSRKHRSIMLRLQHTAKRILLRALMFPLVSPLLGWRASSTGSRYQKWCKELLCSEFLLGGSHLASILVGRSVAELIALFGAPEASQDLSPISELDCRSYGPPVPHVMWKITVFGHKVAPPGRLTCRIIDHKATEVRGWHFSIADGVPSRGRVLTLVW